MQKKIELLVKTIKDRYITAHCNPDFTGDKMKFIFDDLPSLPKEQSVTDEPSDTHKCKECGGRTSLVTGYFVYEPDDEPYMSGIYEKSLIESGECWAGGYVCDACKHVQDLWHE